MKEKTYNPKRMMKALKVRREFFILVAMLLTGGMASAQVVIKGNVYGGCEIGNVSKNTTIEINKGTMKGSVYGGGMGLLDDETKGAVLGNTLIDMKGGTVERSIYGGGELGSVGTFTTFDEVVYPGEGDTPSETVRVPKACQEGTGFVQVLIDGGHVGLSGSTMPHAGSDPNDDDCGWVFAGCQGEADSINYHKANALGVVDSTYLEIKSGVITASVYGGCENGLVLRSTNVKIKGGQIGTGYRGNSVWDDPYEEEKWTAAKTAVTNGTIGTTYVNPFHECDAWRYGETVQGTVHYNVYDYYYGSTYVDEHGATQTWHPDNSGNEGSNGQTFFGKVFGGGSGFYPIAPGIWRRTAGQVRKDTWVEITGGHILTSVYGGNETTDVLGTTHVKMTGGTLGVPRDSASIVRHPVTCYLFGAGMGDPRVLFNTWTNVENVDVEVSGDAFVFGSVFGGGEEGHVLADVDLTIKGNAHIGTLGYSYVEGNVYGGGRGFSGEALTAGTVGGNVTVNIEGGTMLGSVYGGGRLASVGTFFTDPLSDNYGHFQDGEDHGYTTVNISGGRIGNNYEDILHPADHTKGGNVFGGSMGRVTLLDGITENHLWPRLAQVKQTKVNITTADSDNPPIILGNVYGGCEYGSVRDSAIVVFNAENATIYKIFGGGYGSSEIFQTPTNDSLAQPAALAGRVMGNTLVKLKNGTVEMSVYGGGEFASVGRVKRVGNNETLINGIANVIVSGGTIGNNQMYLPDPDPTPDPDPDPTPDPNPVGTRSDYVLHVDHSGHVFGGGQGIANDINETYKDYCNVNHTRVTIKGGKVYGSVFGGGAESHVMGNDSVFIHSGANIGTIGTTAWDGNIFGGGKGNGYMVASREDGDGDEGGEGDEDEEVFVASKTVGRVGGNTYIDMDGGTILGSIFGGGRLGITGIRGIDANGDFDLYLDANGKYDSINHGRATIKVFGKASVVDNDTVYSTVIGTSDYEALLESDESVGDIFGSGKGDVDYYNDIYAGRVANTKITVTGSPRIHGSIFGGGEMASLGYWVDTDEFYEYSGFSEVTVGKLHTADTLILGTYEEFTYQSGDNPGNWTVYDTVNNVVTISHSATGNIYGGCQGDVDTEAPHWISMGRANGTKVNVHGGRILSSVFGGGEQGFVLGNTEVNVTGGTIGQELKSDILNATTHEVTGQGHYHLGSIFGGGYGTTITDLHSNDSLGDNKANAVKWAGRVYGNTEVNFSGGQVYANVYGGGDLASVGRYRASIGGQHNDSLVDHVPVAGTGHCKVNISGTAYVGHYEEGSYGFVFGGGKGVGNDADCDFNLYCNVNTTEVVANLAYSNDNDASNDGRVGGSIFGGSPYGHVLDSTYVELKNGIIGTTGYSAYDGHVFGGGWGDKSNFDAVNRRFASGRVGGTTHVKMTGGTALGCVYGGGLIAMTGVGVDGSFDTYHNAAHEYDSIHHGRSMVEISGGCIGDSINHSTFLLNDEKCGNVYGGGRGDIDEYIEDDFARMANAIVSISGSPVICGSVYGGGQMANVGYWNNYDSWYSEGTGDTRVTISGTPSIGTQLEFDHDNYAVVTPQLQKTVYDTINGVRRLSHTRTGNVFGGGQGDMRIRNGQAQGFEQGHCEKTEVNISGNPVIRSSVYGGSEQGAIWGDTKVNISGGIIGTPEIKSDSLKYENNQWVVSNNHATYSFGSVYGGSYGKDSYKHLHSNSQAIADTVIGYAGRVYRNTKVTITGGHVYENVFGGGNLASVGEFSKMLGGQSGDSLIAITPKAGTGHCEVNVSGSAVVGPLDNTGLNAYVYGGGKGVGDDPSNLYKTYCNVNSAAVTVNLNSNGRVYGSLFGGGSDAHTLGDVSVTLNGGLIGTEGKTSYDGNIFGGGRNYLRHNYTAGRVGGNTTVEMTNGQIMGCIFGGGRIALTGADVNGALQSGNTVGNTKVMVKGGTVGNNTPTGNTADPNEIVVETFADYSMGSVYGGGMGHIEGIIGHPRASALLVAIVKNTEVEISDTLNHNTHVYGIVYGGGEVSNVGSYSFVNEVVNNEAHIHSIDTVAGTGLAKVTISGGIIGGDRSQMRYTLADGTYWPLYNDDLGYVYGGGKGISDNPNAFPKVYEGAYGDESHATSLINLMGTTIHTEVTISEAAGRRTWVKGSVFGGSEAGHVRGNTLVTISGGQIGAGYSQTGVDLHYNEGQFINPVTTAITNANALQGTVHWDFGRVVGNDTIYAPFDLVDLSNGIIPSDGKSWFGNVFGGGSGWFPYVENPGTEQAQCSWNPLCGKVWGNTHVVVEGGHILNNVYGGNESTDVGGKTLVEIKGGTVGVPRTKQQIIDLPTIGYVFGGGCGDPRTVFDNLNNVDSTKVDVTGGTIYGSVYGGAEDGHVLGDVRVSVSGEAITTNGVTSNSTIIGCKGLSTADGNIFGGGRNYLGENNKAGRVGGNISINLTGGYVQGSVFGGGRMALSGVNANGVFPTTDWPVADHGNVTINVSGMATTANGVTTYSTVIGNADNNGSDLLKLNDESVGDIMGSGKGDTKNYQNILAGRVTNATINVTGSPRIYGSVFGGGEMASLGWWEGNDGAIYFGTGKAIVNIGREGQSDNPVIGTYLELDATYAQNPSEWTIYNNGKLIHTCTGNVFGGSQGDVDVEDWDLSDPSTLNKWPYMGRSREAVVNIYGGTIMSEVYGGSEQGSLTEDTHVTVKGGTIGSPVATSLNSNGFFGSVVGAGYGSDDDHESPVEIDANGTRVDELAGRVYGDVTVDMLGGTVVGDVYGGAAFAYVGEKQTRTDKGNVTVNIGNELQLQMHDPDQGPTILGNVFGANYDSGTPYGNVLVNVYSTRHNHPDDPDSQVVDNCYPHTAPTTPSELDQLPHDYANFALRAVYGGSDRADYTPLPNKTATVHVYDCDENTIYDVYGGCNAAAIGPSTSGGTVNSYVIIDGGYFNRVFGGGNGEGGISADIHGSANTTINGGLIQNLFGGSNNLGQIDEINLTINEEGDCGVIVGNGYGGNNSADVIADVTTTLNCGEGAYANFYGGSCLGDIYGNLTVNVMGGTYTNFFAGSRGQAANPTATPPVPGFSADIREITAAFAQEHGLDASLVGHGGNITLNLYGGNIENAFGGSDVWSQIDGKITVNVIDTVKECGLELTNLYGAGRYTTYKPLLKNGQVISSPEVNVIHGDVLGNVYGGAYGDTATVYANPVVRIGYDATSMADVVAPFITPQEVFDFDTAVAHVYGNVYGGGNLAQIDGNTLVNVYKGEVGEIGYTYKHDNNSHEVYDSIYHVEYDVVNHLVGGSVYGSGKGSYTNMDNGRVKGNTSVNISGGHVYYSVYGGGEMASVGKHTNVLEDPNDLDSDIIDIAPVANTGLATVTITGGQVGPAPKTDEGYNIPIGLNGMDGYVFGGGKGDSSDEHDLYKAYTNVNTTNVIVQIPSDANPLTNRIWGSVFGGSEDGHVLGDVAVSYRSGILGTLGNTTYDGNIFGSGRNFGYSSDVSGRVRGNVTVGMSGGHIKGNIYGGGRLGATGIDMNGNMKDDDAEHTYGHSIVSVSGGEVGTTVNSETSGNVYGGGMGRYIDDEGWQMEYWETFGAVKQTQVNISDAVVHGSVYGGGEIALVEKTTEVNITSGTIGGDSGSGSYYGSVFGGGKGFLGLSNAEANPKAGQVGVSTEVNMSGGQVYENVYGGGEIASVGNYTYNMDYVVDDDGYLLIYDILNVTGGTTNVNITGGRIGPLDGTGMNGYVFGAGQGVSNDVTEYFKAFANVVDANVTISDNAQVDGSVLGGSAEGHVLEDVTINITGGTIGIDGYSLGDGNVLGGGGNQSLSNYSAGRVGGNVEITISQPNNDYPTLIKGNVYGGGYAGMTGVDANGNVYTSDLTKHGNVTINISGGTIGNTTVIDDQFVGNVFGSGKGVETDSLFGLTLNTNVCISGTAQVLGDVYGGGEMASVGDFIYDNTVTDSITGVTAGTGTAKVAIRGGQVGVEREGQSIALKGRVFGGGLGKVTLTDDYLNIGNVGNTEVLIADTKVSEMETVSPYIVNSVFGGAMNGHVIKNTSVMVKGGTIGKPLTLAERKADESGQVKRILTGNVYGGGSGATVLGYAPINNTPGAPEYPQYSQKAGRVYGNTEVTVKAGTVRHAVYGGGNMASVGIFSTDGDGIATYTAGGKTTVTIDSVALIGPKKADLAGDQITENYKYLGANEGWVFGSSRGISGGKLKHMSFVDTTIVNIGGNAQVVSCVFGGGENGHVQKGTNVNVTGGIIGGIPMHGTSCTATSGEYADVALTGLDDELDLDEYGIGRRVFRGNVFGGGKGNDSIIWQTPFKYCYTAGRVYGNTHVTVSGGTIYNRVYGGGTIASVGTFEYDNPNNAQAITGVVEKTGHAYVTVNGGQIGTDGKNNGDVVGGGRGLAGRPKKQGETLTSITQPLTQAPDEAYVGNTYVTINGGSIANCVYGGSINGHVQEDSHVVIDQVNNAKPTIIGTLVGGSTVQGGWHSNVYGGGGGMSRYTDGTNPPHLSVTSGRVFGDTYVEIKGGTIYNNVYGGGAIASVGTYDLDPEAESPYVGHGYTHVTVTGGTIGYNGEGNGHVFGAARGWPDAPLAYLDTLSYAAYTEVNIGTKETPSGGGDPSYSGNALIKGSVFGSGENGHTYKQANVNIYSGTIEHSVYGGGEGEDTYMVGLVPHYNPIAGVVAGNTEVKMEGGTVKGNVYGGGRMASVGVFLQNNEGTPELIVLPDVGDDTFGHTKVEITGGSIGRVDEHVNDVISETYPRSGCVFGGSKGMLLDSVTYPKWTKLANVKMTDVTVGGTALVKSSVYGGSEMGRVYNSTYVKIQGNAEIGAESESLAFHRGNVYGGGCGLDSITYHLTSPDRDTIVYMRAAGQVEGNTRVEMTGGKVYGNVYGANEMTDVLGHASIIMDGGQVGWQRDSLSIANKPRYGYVYGAGKGHPSTRFNTWTNVDSTYIEVTENMNRIYGCVFGGGEEAHVLRHTHVVVNGGTIGTLGSTGKEGNVFGAGRGKNPEALTAGSIGGNTYVDINGGTMLGSIFGGGNNGSVGIYLVPSTSNLYGKMQAGSDHGFTTVNVTGGTIGHTEAHSNIGGNVYGGGRGMAGAPGTVYQKLAKVKQTEVNIREASGKQTFIIGSVFGSGEDGHVLQDTYVNVYGGQIGGDTYQANIDNVEACGNIYHGNVYGGGRGVDTYNDNEGHPVHSITAGKVERNTYVTIYGGRITRNVYGGGNLSSVGDAAYDTTGHANVNVVGGYIGTLVNEDDYHGNVFGGGHGGILGEYINLAYVKYTHVTVDSTARIFGSVFGGGEDGHVRKNAVVDMKGGIVGKNADTDKLHGNVYGGGRGIIQKHGQVSPTAGEVFGHTTVNLMKSDKKHDGIAYTPEIYNNVYGGGSRSVVGEYKVVNIAAGLVHDNVFGGSRDIPPKRSNKAPRWVNMWGGKVEGAIYGCSHNSIDSVGNGAKDKWASFINLSGGSVNNIFGAGYGGDIEGILHDTVRGGIVRGSVAVLIGKNAIENANKTVIGEADSLVYKINNQIPQDSLIIRGNVFAGSDLVNDSTWGKYAVTGYSHIYIDGTGYNTTDGPTATNYMSIVGGVYGSSSNCEAGKEGHSILVRNYGTRGTGDEFSVYRKLATIQRCDTLLLDHSNLNLSGANDITNADVNGDNPRKKYGVLKVDNAMMVANGSGLVLGASQQAVYIDSVMQVRSLYWNGGEGSSVYQHAAVHNNSNWEWIGIKDSDNKLYRIPASGDPVQLTAAQENVIRFNNMSKMWVRTHERMNNSLGVARDTSVYGELQGFFRLRADSYDPHGDESFAYARPKFTSPDRSEPDENTSDGGFLSYRDSHNFFTDGGANYTKTKQYPYINEVVRYPEDPVRGNFSDWRRKWVYPQNGHIWYVDGTRGWGRDILRSDDPNAGRYPDKPKKTITGQTAGGVGSGVVSDTYTGKFSYFKDHIYVVGALSALDEVGPLCDSVGADGTHYPLRLYRYPGGHVMSNTKPDYGGGEATSGVNFVNVGESNAGPGANYGALLNVQGNDESAGASITLRGVLMDGLNGYSPMEVESHNIPTEAPFTVYDSTQVSMPLVLTHKNATLTLEGGTELMRGYNKTDAKDWYYNADYRAPSGAASLSVYHGGAIFVDSLATVNVNGKVIITGNTQNLNGTPVESNVYLPTFNKSLNITGTLHDNTSIGVTSPKRNKEKSYYDNTFSPVAVAGDKTYASSAWTNNNFLDDQDWFFGRNNKNTYYFDGEGSLLDAKTVYFGWTWANVVRKQPAGYTGNGSNITISSEEGMAWLISKSVGMNGEIATDFSNVNISQTADLDMKQYVWVPLGYESKPFKGTYDGRGHLIDSLIVEYLGKNDMRYQRNDYGMFGDVNNGTVKRTFVVSGKMSPASIPDNRDEAVTYYIGGLVGQLEGVYAEVSNSEAANVIICPNYSSEHDVVAGGLVGQMTNGHIHSSMVISTIEMGALVQGPVGGMVGSATAGDIYNSFANVKFNVTGGSNIKTIGGLLGDNTGAKMSNCYLALDNTSVLSSTNFGSIVYSNTTSSNIDSCYVTQNAYSMAREGGCHSSCHQYTSVIGSDNLGYMYADNKVMDITSRTDSTLFQLLNKWVSKKGIQYGHWARPGLSEINSDLPVLLLCDMSVTNVESTDDFRSLATYNKGKALQYGGTTRDGSDKHLSEMLKRDEYVFVYGDIDGHDSSGLETSFDGDGALATVTINADKVSIYEHASIKYPGKLADLIDTYVGITFDNSFGQATATPGVNVGLVGPDGYSLPRDWHMFSSPLNNAPLGFNYIVGENNTNTNTYTSGNQGTYYNNIWMNQAAEFSWLTQLGSDECVSGAGNRYWMKTFDANDQKTDGYFPTRRGSLFADHLDDLFVVGSDECPSSGKYRYPYGMDFYTWNEPVFHWINFKRNGPNHWNSENPHEHLDYVPVYGATPNQNEEKLIVGRGYMAAITTASFMQSHGNLNDNSQSIMLTNTPSSLLKGWNLVGNPYHGYLDFDLVASGDNLTVLSDQNYLSENADEGVFYVVYNADKYSNRDASTAFRYYPVRGSEGGDYAEQYLHPHQGFYVKAKAAGNLTFNESMLVSRETVAGNSHFRADRPAYPLVNLYLSSDQGCADVTVIEFERPEWGGATKLKELRVGDGVFYAQHDNTHYAALFAKAGIDRVPVWFEAKEDDIFTLKWNLANADFHSMYLIDNKTGVQYDMLRNNTYSFEGHKGDYPSRFLIVFSLTDVDEHLEGDGFVFFDGSQWMVTGEGDLEFIDVQGQVLLRTHVNDGQSRVAVPDVAPGVYLFRLTNSSNTRVQKVIVKR